MPVNRDLQAISVPDQSVLSNPSATDRSKLAYEVLLEVTSGLRAAIPNRENGKSTLREHQSAIISKVDDLFSQGRRTVSIEVGCGQGKTVISGKLAEKYVNAGGKVLFVSPSKTAMGDYRHGNISIFYDIFGERVGEVNDTGLLPAVYCFTPHKLCDISIKEPKYFQKLIAQCSLIILDEAHRFPDDTPAKQRTVIIGRIKEIVTEHCSHAKVLTMTATHTRADGLLPFGQPEPDIKYTIANGIRDGWTPDIYGLPVYIDGVTVDKVVKSGDTLKLRMKPAEMTKYEAAIVENVYNLARDYKGQPHCFFVRTIHDAFRLRDKLNERFGYKAFDCLVSKQHNGSTTTPEMAKAIIQEVRNGNLLGYITVNLGVESVDVEKLTFCHLIVRTTSKVKLMQAVGRVLRKCEGKKMAVVVDYLILKKSVIRGCLGLWDYAKNAGSTIYPGSAVVGGSLFTGRGALSPQLEDKTFTYGKQEEWLTRITDNNITAEHLTQDYWELKMKLGRQPTINEYAEQCHGFCVLTRVFGSPGWKNLLKLIREGHIGTSNVT